MMGKIGLIILGIIVGIVAILILIPVFAFLVNYANWWEYTIEEIMEERAQKKEEKEIDKFKRNL